MAYSYDKNVDYQALINEAVAKKDYNSAAILEQQRNAKGQGEGIEGFTPTNNYAGNLDTTDYSTMLKQQMGSGASGDTVKNTLNNRVNKANGAVNLKQYVNDDLYQSAMNYIAGGSGDFSYADAPKYVSKYQGQIDSLFNQIVNGSFSDFLGTPEYSALNGQYTKQGQKAMQDTVGDVASRTGGLASSFAVTAGQQAYGNQMDALEDAAMQMFENQKSDKMNELSALSSLESNDYNEYQGKLGQYDTDRDFAYQTKQDRQSLSTGKADNLASVGDFSGYVGLGYMTQAQADQQQKAWAVANPKIALKLYPVLAAQLGLKATSSGSGSGSGGVKGTTGDGNGSIYDQMYAEGVTTKDSAKAWLREHGYKAGDASTYASIYVNEKYSDLEDADSTKTSSTVTGWGDAINQVQAVKSSGFTYQQALSQIDADKKNMSDNEYALYRQALATIYGIKSTTK